MKIKIVKLEQLPDGINPGNIETGSERIIDCMDIFYHPPTIGEMFLLQEASGRYFHTSTVQEVIDDHTFKTLNSIYQWNIIE